MESSEGWFVDMVNPTEAEILRWAHAEAFEPMEDWDLIISDPVYARLLVRLVSDPQCRATSSCLRALYVLTGDTVRSSVSSDEDTARLRDAIVAANASASEPLRLWAYRSERLLQDPAEFEYSAWCDGGLARTPRQPMEAAT